MAEPDRVINDFQGWINSDTSVVVNNGYVIIDAAVGNISLPLNTFKAIHTLLFLRGIINE